MADDLTTALRRSRQGYDEELTWHRFCLDAYTGGGEFQGTIRQPEAGRAAQVYGGAGASRISSSTGRLIYLSRFPREDDPKFQGRIDIAHYPSYVEPLTDIKLGYLLDKDPDRELTDPVKEWRNDCDGKGTPFDVWRARLALRAAVFGWVPVVIDLDLGERDEQGAPVPITQAHADARGIRPRLVPLFPANLLEYALDEAGDFTWAKVRTTREDHSDWRADPAQIEHYTIWTRVDFATYEVRGKTGAAQEVTSGTHEFDRVSIAILSHRELPEGGVGGLPMHGQVSIQAKRLFNLESELDEHIRSQVFAILQVPTDNPDSLGELMVGTDNALPVKSDARQGYEYIAPLASVAATLEKRIEVTTREIYRMARVEFTRPTAQATSAESRAFEFQATNQAIKNFAKSLSMWEESIYGLVEIALGRVPGENRVTPPRSFDIDNLMRDLSDAMAAVDLDLSPRAHAEMKKRIVRRMLPNLPDDEYTAIEAQLDEAADREGLMGAMGAEMAQAAAAGQDDVDPGSAGDDAKDNDADDFPNQE